MSVGVGVSLGLGVFVVFESLWAARGSWACKSCAQKFGSAMPGEGTGPGWHGNVRYLKFKRCVGRGWCESGLGCFCGL